MAKTAVQEVSEMMQRVISEHNAEMEACRQNVEETKQRIADAKKAMQEATDKTDLTAYAKAKQQKAQEETALEMYTAKLQNTEKAGYVSDEESDSAIKKLWNYQDGLEEDYIKDVAKHVSALLEIMDTYNNANGQAVDTLGKWTGNVHQFFGGAGYPVTTGNRTPVQPYKRRDVALTLNQIITEFKNIKVLMKYVNE